MQQDEQPTATMTQAELNARLGDPTIDKDNPFGEDILKRKRYAEILTNVLSIYTHGAVIALNGKWGTGKTTFVKKWQAMLELEQYGFTTRIQELVQEIEKIIPSKMVSDTIQTGNYDADSFTYTIAELLVTYCNEERIKEMLVSRLPEEHLTFEPHIINAKRLLQYINHFDNSSHGGNCPIKHLTDKINLLDRFMS